MGKILLGMDFSVISTDLKSLQQNCFIKADNKKLFYVLQSK